MGEYLGRIYREVRRRPRFVIRETQGPPSRVLIMLANRSESHSSRAETRLVLKVDIDTKVGLLEGVPRLMPRYSRKPPGAGLVFHRHGAGQLGPRPGPA